MKKEDEDDESSSSTTTATMTTTTLGRESRDAFSSSLVVTPAATSSRSGSVDEEVLSMTTQGVSQQERKPKGLTSPRAANPLKHTERTLINLAVLMAKPPNGIAMKDRRYRLRLVRNCFQGRRDERMNDNIKPPTVNACLRACYSLLCD